MTLNVSYYYILKHLKSYKIFESTISPTNLRDFINDISLDLSDIGFTLGISDDTELNEYDQVVIIIIFALKKIKMNLTKKIFTNGQKSSMLFNI
jgi:hypothetical protein